MKVFRTLYSYNQPTCQQPDFFFKKKTTTWPKVSRTTGTSVSVHSETRNGRTYTQVWSSQPKEAPLYMYNFLFLLHVRHVTKYPKNFRSSGIYIYNKIKHKTAANLQMSWGNMWGQKFLRPLWHSFLRSFKKSFT